MAYIRGKEMKCYEYIQRIPMNIHGESGHIHGALKGSSISCGCRKILGLQNKSRGWAYELQSCTIKCSIPPGLLCWGKGTAGKEWNSDTWDGYEYGWGWELQSSIFPLRRQPFPNLWSSHPFSAEKSFSNYIWNSSLGPEWPLQKPDESWENDKSPQI